MFGEGVTKSLAERTLISLFPGLKPEEVKWKFEEGKILNAEFNWIGGQYEMEIGIDGKLISSDSASDQAFMNFM
jgi:hypothetical protein